MLVHATTHANEKCKSEFVAAINRSRRKGRWRWVKDKANRPPRNSLAFYWHSWIVNGLLRKRRAAYDSQRCVCIDRHTRQTSDTYNLINADSGDQSRWENREWVVCSAESLKFHDWRGWWQTEREEEVRMGRLIIDCSRFAGVVRCSLHQRGNKFVDFCMINERLIQ